MKRPKPGLKPVLAGMALIGALSASLSACVGEATFDGSSEAAFRASGVQVYDAITPEKQKAFLVAFESVFLSAREKTIQEHAAGPNASDGPFALADADKNVRETLDGKTAEEIINLARHLKKAPVSVKTP